MNLTDSTIESQKIRDLHIRKVSGDYPFELLSISLEKGSVFPQHHSPKRAVLLVLEGSMVFYMDHGAHRLSRFQIFHIPAKVAHWIEAVENCKFLIIR